MESGSVVTWMSEDNYMFRLSAFTDRLLDWYRSSPQGKGCMCVSRMLTAIHMHGSHRTGASAAGCD